MTGNSIRFLLNDECITLDDIDPNLTVLQFLRDYQFAKGTKEGCAAGDCGACTVVIAELAAEDENQLQYKSINACITFVASLDGKQLITVEALKQEGKLHSVQQALVDYHGSQCGFCTPGFVMSSFALHKNSPSPSREEVIEDLSGNLCRCTGYRPIIDAAMETTKDVEDSFSQQATQTIEQLKNLHDSSSHGNLSKDGKVFYFAKSLEQLATLYKEHPTAILLAGGTDLALEVTQGLNSFDKIIHLNDVPELNTINESETEITLGAAVCYSECSSILTENYADFAELINRIGAKQVRNNGTLGGNIANASPIGDMPPALIALNAKLILQSAAQERTILLQDFFTGYKQTLLEGSEFIKAIIIPKLKTNQHLKLYKISKRFDDDISALLAALSITLEKNNVTAITIAFGGMAAIPKRAIECEKALLNKPFTVENIALAQKALIKDFQPMTDVRASSSYRMQVAQNLLVKCYLEITDKTIETRVIAHA